MNNTFIGELTHTNIHKKAQDDVPVSSQETVQVVQQRMG